VIVLCRIDEFVRALEQEIDLEKLLDAKIDKAIIDKNPYFVPTF
jgi:hypothetical protein